MRPKGAKDGREGRPCRNCGRRPGASRRRGWRGDARPARDGGPGGTAGRTQFANDLLATELADRLRGTRVEVTCVFPGVTDTGVFRNSRGLPPLARALAPVIVWLVALSPEEAARTPVFLAQDPRAAGTGGCFYGPKLKQREIPPRARRPERRGGLWAASEDLVRPYPARDPGRAAPGCIGGKGTR